MHVFKGRGAHSMLIYADFFRKPVLILEVGEYRRVMCCYMYKTFNIGWHLPCRWYKCTIHNMHSSFVVKIELWKFTNLVEFIY